MDSWGRGLTQVVNGIAVKELIYLSGVCLSSCLSELFDGCCNEERKGWRSVLIYRRKKKGTGALEMDLSDRQPTALLCSWFLRQASIVP